MLDLVEDPLLRAGETKRKSRNEFFRQQTASLVSATDSRRIFRARRRDLHLHPEKFAKHQNGTDLPQQFIALGEMNSAECIFVIAVSQRIGQTHIRRRNVNLLEQPKNQPTQHPLRQTLGRWINRGDPAKMN